MSGQTRVIILGGGYSAVWAYRAVNRWMGKKAQITVVSAAPSHTFHGFIGEVLSGDMPASHLESPIAECFPKATRIIGKATLIDEANNIVVVETEEGRQDIPYDQLMVATGAKENLGLVPGLEEHSWVLRTHGNPALLTQHVEGIWGSKELSDPEVLQKHVVVVGAGFTGTEAAAALGRRAKDRGRVTLISSSPQVAPVWNNKPNAQKNLRKHLDAAGVTTLLQTRVVEADSKGVLLDDGTHLPADVIISSLGNTPVLPAGLEHYMDLKTGLLAVDKHLNVSGNIWAAGDVAAVRRPNGELVRKDALWAIFSGTRVGRNIARASRNVAPKVLGFPGLGSAASFQPGKSVVVIFGLNINGLPAYLLRQSLFLFFVPSRKHALRIMFSK